MLERQFLGGFNNLLSQSSSCAATSERNPAASSSSALVSVDVPAPLYRLWHSGGPPVNGGTWLAWSKTTHVFSSPGLVHWFSSCKGLLAARAKNADRVWRQEGEVKTAWWKRVGLDPRRLIPFKTSDLVPQLAPHQGALGRQQGRWRAAASAWIGTNESQRVAVGSWSLAGSS